ncbi:c-type cytochrome [Rufibacter soli]|jgi:mono/diheme cytochrome c family protein
MKKQVLRFNNRIAMTFKAAMRFPALLLIGGALLVSCSSEKKEETKAEYNINEGTTAAAEPEDDGKGVGPVKTVDVGADIDQALATNGKSIFEGKCSACHQLSDQKIVGPGLAGVTKRRSPEWIMNMIINPDEMTKKDPTAKKLLAEHLTQMTNQNINEADARALLEYLRQNDKSI